MKHALFAAICTLGAAACGGESRPAESPAGVTTETTTTSASEAARRNEAATTPPPAAPAPRPAETPESQRLDTSPKHDASDFMMTPPTPSTPPTLQNPGAADNTKDATNTKINDRDRHGALTPTDQGGGKDRDITAAIRRAVMSDGSLSFASKNVKIITVGGKVTLRGAVKTDAERATIESKAKAAAGVTEVDNQLEVKK